MEEDFEEGIFENVKVAPAPEINGLWRSFYDDYHQEKINLAIETYRTDDGKPWVLPVVHTIESQMAIDSTLNHEYLPPAGMPDFREATVTLVLGSDSPAIQQGRADSVQMVGLISAFRIGLDFLHKQAHCDTVYISKPCDDIYRGVADSVGFQTITEYRYWDNDKRWIDFEGLKEDLNGAPEKAVVILHASAHFPTGMDLGTGQWDEIFEIIKERKLFPFFISSSQGLANDTFEKDVASMRNFDKGGMDFFVAQSFSTTFGLYGERPASLVMVTSSKETLMAVRSQIETCLQHQWGSPPSHGARIVATVLNNPAFFSDWRDHVKNMSNRIRTMRGLLYEKLRALGTPGEWDHIVKQTGMSCFTGLTEKQCNNLAAHHQVYMTKDGRINVCGLTSRNIDKVVHAIHDVVSTEEQ